MICDFSAHLFAEHWAQHIDQLHPPAAGAATSSNAPAARNKLDTVGKRKSKRLRKRSVLADGAEEAADDAEEEADEEEEQVISWRRPEFDFSWESILWALGFEHPNPRVQRCIFQ